MRVTLVSPLATGAMEQALNCLAIALQQTATVTVVAPAHFVPSPDFQGEVVFLPTPASRRQRALYWYNPAALPAAIRLIRRTRPDVVHLFNAQGYLLSLALPYLLRRPLMVSVHDPVAHSGAYADQVQYTAARYLMLPRVDRIHTMSHYGFELLRQQGFPAKKLVETRLGAFTEIFSRHNRPDTVRGTSLLFFGRWEPYKGIDILVDAIVSLAERGIREHCILAGPGTVPPATRAKIEAHPDLFEVHNYYVADADAAGFFQRANRTVLPYRDATQSALPAIASAYRHLIIATRVGSFTEETALQGGILVEPGSVEALAEGIERSRTMQRPETAPVDYSWSTVAATLDQAYRSMLLPTGGGH